jgi:hypothetical protein
LSSAGQAERNNEGVTKVCLYGEETATLIEANPANATLQLYDIMPPVLCCHMSRAGHTAMGCTRQLAQCGGEGQACNDLFNNCKIPATTANNIFHKGYVLRQQIRCLAAPEAVYGAIQRAAGQSIHKGLCIKSSNQHLKLLMAAGRST